MNSYRRLLALVASILIATLALAVPPLMANEHCVIGGSGEAGGGSVIIVGGGECDDGGGSGGGGGSGDPADDDPVVARVIVDIYWGYQGGCAAGYYEALVEVRLVFPDGSWEHVAWEEDCWEVPVPGEPGDGSELDPFSVTEEVRKRLPAPSLSVSPDAGGITGMETWFWYDHAPENLTAVDSDDDGASDRPGYELDLTIAGNTVSATVWPSGYRWHVDDGATLTSTRPGSEDDPAVTYDYEVKGQRLITVEVVWTGWWEQRTAAGGLVTGGSFQPFTMSGAHPYTVREVKAEPAD